MLLERGAEWFTEHTEKLALSTGLSLTLVGLLTAGIEWEELVVVALAAFGGQTDLAVGDVIGSCIANLTASFALGPLFRPLAIGRDDRRFALALLVLTGLAVLFLQKGQLGRFDGLLLLLGFALYLAFLVGLTVRGLLKVHFERENDDDDDDDDDDDHDSPQSSTFRTQLSEPATPPTAFRLYALALFGLGLIVVGAWLVVQSALFVAQQFGLSEFVIGVTVVAFGTTLPDKVISIAGAIKGQAGIVSANAIGSNICNLFAGLGLAALVQPLAVNLAVVGFDLLFLLGVTGLFALLYLQRQVGRWSGGLLLGLYVVYIVIKLV